MLDFISHEAPRDVVLVHGAGENNLLWTRTLQQLSGGSRGVAPNLPGHPRGDIVCNTVDGYAEAVHRFIVESNMRGPAVCGHSMGGAIALSLATGHPDDVGALILVSTGAKLGVDRRILEGLGDRPMKTIEETITPWSFNSIDLDLAREARTALSISNLPVFLNDYQACQNFDGRLGIPKINSKTLVVCGDKDRMTPPKWSHYLKASMLDSELYFVKDSGHMLPLEKPGSLAALVQSFLEGLNR